LRKAAGFRARVEAYPIRFSWPSSIRQTALHSRQTETSSSCRGTALSPQNGHTASSSLSNQSRASTDRASPIFWNLRLQSQDRNGPNGLCRGTNLSLGGFGEVAAQALGCTSRESAFLRPSPPETARLPLAVSSTEGELPRSR
jgi:hypothetical protein